MKPMVVNPIPMLENPVALIEEPPTIQEFNKILKVQGADKTSDHEEQMKAQEVEEITKINEQPKSQDLNACKLYLRS